MRPLAVRDAARRCARASRRSGARLRRAPRGSCLGTPARWRARAARARGVAASSRSSSSRDTPAAVARVAEVQVARERVARGAQRRQQAVERLPLASQVGEPAAALEDLDLALEHVDRRRELRLERRARRACATKRVGILALGQRHHLHRRALPQQLVAGAEGRLEPRLVGVVEQEDALGVAPDRASPAPP